MILNETYTLENGLSIPKLGLGTWFIDDDQAAEAVRTAVKLGYRLIDTAQAYGNERGVGVGIRTCGVPREALFLTSKVAAEAKTYDAAAKSIDASLEKLGLDEVNLADLINANVIKSNMKDARVILSGEITRKVTVRGMSVTKGAKAAIEAAGGSVVVDADK